MPSDKRIKESEVVFSLPNENSSGSEGSSELWRELRHFYRTGEQPKGNSIKELQSIFHSILAKEGSDTAGQFEASTPFKILQQILAKNREKQRQKFRQKLSELIAGLGSLLAVKKEDDKEVFEFANDLVAFEKLAHLLPKKKNQTFSKKRIDRLQQVLRVLEEGASSLDDKMGTVLVSRSNQFDLAPIGKSELVIGDHGYLLQGAEQLMTKKLGQFTELIRSFRIADLEVQGAFNEEVHDDYFDHFSWYRLSEVEKSLFDPFFIVADHRYLIDHLDEFSRLLSSNRPYRFWVINEDQVSSPQSTVSWEDASHSFRQELVAVAFSHRNVLTYQTILADDKILNDLEESLQFNGPLLVHLLVPSGTPSIGAPVLSAASGARYFPEVTYEPFGKEVRLEVRRNVQYEKDWPVYAVKLNSSQQAMEVALTYADYKALFRQKVEELMLIPATISNDEYLIPLSEYLEMDEVHLVGKIPFVWLQDDKRQLYRAAVPNLWVVSCQERLDFWNFLQQFGGITATESEESQEEPHDLEITQQSDESLAEMHDAAMKQSTEKLIAFLLSE